MPVNEWDMIHQKPEALLRTVSGDLSDEGNVTADFFCGSGTTLITAEKLGRQWVRM